jgi:hypothetical protein
MIGRHFIQSARYVQKLCKSETRGKRGEEQRVQVARGKVKNVPDF